MSKRITYLLASVLLLVVLVLTAVDVCCFNRSFYAKEYTKLGVADTIGINSDELEKTTEVLLDYTQGKREDMVVTATVKGAVREVFNAREKAHMVDVRNLYLTAMAVRNISLAGFLVLLLFSLYQKRNMAIQGLITAYQRVSLVFVLFLTMLAGVALTDFNWFWTNFHHVFFAGNDLWLLNPDTDILIMMVPEQFFFDLVFRIVVTFLIVFVGTHLFGYFYQRQKKQKKVTV